MMLAAIAAMTARSDVDVFIDTVEYDVASEKKLLISGRDEGVKNPRSR
jgi:hypothetical protein